MRISTRESNIRVAVYVRKFSEKETLLFSERNQEEICTKVIGANDNWDLIQIYRNDNCSQQSTCLQLNQLIRDAENRKIDLIITPEVERFGKGAILAYELSQKLLEYGNEGKKMTQEWMEWTYEVRCPNGECPLNLVKKPGVMRTTCESCKSVPIRVKVIDSVGKKSVYEFDEAETLVCKATSSILRFVCKVEAI